MERKPLDAPLKEFVCISLRKLLGMDIFVDVYQNSLTLDFAYGYIRDCSICSRAIGILH